MTEISLFSLSPYLFLLAAVCFSLGGKGERWILAMLVPALIFAFLNEIIGVAALGIMLIAPLALFVWINHFFANLLRGVGFIIFVVSAFLMVSHHLPDIQNLKLFDQLVFNQGSAAFDMYLNFDKVYLAVVLFTLLPPLERQMPFRSSWGLIIKYFAVAVLVLLPMALGLGFVELQTNTNPYLILWAVNNFFFVCFAEEVIFRRFIQNQLVHQLRNKQYGDLVAIFLGALVFGAAHISGGLVYVALSSVAGIFYGLCFYHTCNVRSAMAIHFMVNLAHAFLFTYPFAAASLGQ